MGSAVLARSVAPTDQGLELLANGRTAEAVRLLARVARNNRLDGNAQHAYGLALHGAGQYAEAVDQFGRADRLLPGRWQVHQNLSAAYHGLRDFEAAQTAALRSLELRPDNAGVLLHLADIHLIWGQMPEAYGYYEQALTIDPNIADGWVGKMFCHDLLPGVTGEDALAERRRFAQIFETSAKPFRLPHRQSRDPERRLRIGFISGDVRDHTAAYMYGALYRHLNREQFQVFTYAAADTADGVTSWFEKVSNGWRSMYKCSPQQIAAAIRADEIDVLVDTAGYTSGGYLPVFCLKPAPIQVQAWGYLTGSGLDAMDAILVDDVLVPPEHESHFSERMLRVPYALGFEINGDIPITERPADRPLTFGHLGRSDKVNPEAVALWASVLRAYPGSQMVLKDRGFSRERTLTNVRRWFAAEGITPGHLDIRGESSRGEHLAAYNDVDVVLDSVPQGGGTTTMEALWMGTPVVTILGQRIIGRIAATTIHAVGHDAWIAADAAEYVRLAGQVAQDGGPQLRAELTASVVCNGALRTQHFETAIRGLWRTYCEQGAA